MNKPESEPNDITKHTKKKSKNKIKNDITKTKWTRICSICKCTMYYASNVSKLHADWGKTSCKSCGKEKPHNVEFHRNCPTCHKTIYYRSKCSLLNANQTNAWCSQCRNSGQNNPFYGKQHTDEHRKYKRNGKIKQLAHKGIVAGYNPVASQYFQQLNESMNWNGTYAENGGEVIIAGYYVDFYDVQKNIVVEYDEPHHEKPSKKKLDVIRQNNILQVTNGRFFRYSEKYNKLYEVFKEIV